MDEGRGGQRPEEEALLLGGAASASERRRLRGAAASRVPVGLARKAKIADKLVFSKIRHALGVAVPVRGLRRARRSRATSPQFFFGAGVRIYEGYGLTEPPPPPSPLSTEIAPQPACGHTPVAGPLYGLQRSKCDGWALPPARASSAQHECDEAPDLTSDRSRLLAPGHGFGRLPAVPPVCPPAPLQTLGRAGPGTRPALDVKRRRKKSVNYGWPTFSGLTPLRGRAIRGSNGSARRASS